jgi:uncharacterized protein
MRFDRRAVARTRRGDAPLHLAVAGDPWRRLCGLMFRAPMRWDSSGTPGLLLTDCTALHGCFLREAVDVAFLCERGRVTQVERLARFGVATAATSYIGEPRHAVELPRGSIARLGILPGDWVLPIRAGASASSPSAFEPVHPAVSRWARA